MKNIFFKILFFGFLLSCFFKTSAFDVASLGKIDSSVIDKVWVLSQTEKKWIEDKIAALRTKYTTEILLVILKTTDGEDISAVWTEIWQKIWVWKSDKDNWVVILIAIDDRAWNISTGYWVEWVLPDILTNRIGQKNFILFKESRYYDGIMWTLDEFWKAFEWDPSIISMKNETEETPIPWIIWIIFIVIFSNIFLKPLIKKEKYTKFWIIFSIAFILTLPFSYYFIKEIIGTVIANIIIWIIALIFWIFWKTWYNWTGGWSWKSGWWWGWFGWFGWGSFGGWWSSWKW